MIFSAIKWPAVVITAFRLVLIGFLAAWYLQSKRWDAVVSEITADDAISMQQIASTAQATIATSLAKQQAAEKAAVLVDAKYTQDLANANSEIETLRADIVTGAVELHFNATCDAGSSAALPGKSSGTGSANAARHRLIDAAQREYHTLEQSIAVATARINGLQAYIKGISRVSQ